MTATTKSSPGFDKRNEERKRRVLGEGGAERKVAAASLHDDVLPHSEECYEREADCASANLDMLAGSSESTSGGEVAAEVPC